MVNKKSRVSSRDFLQRAGAEALPLKGGLCKSLASSSVVVNIRSAAVAGGPGCNTALQEGESESGEQQINRFSVSFQDLHIVIFFCEVGKITNYYETSHYGPGFCNRVTNINGGCNGYDIVANVMGLQHLAVQCPLWLLRWSTCKRSSLGDK